MSNGYGRAGLKSSDTTRNGSTGRIAVPAILIGVGLGAMLEGVVFHQLLQWHHLMSDAGDARIGLAPFPDSGLVSQIWWDGIFHVGALIILVLGLAHAASGRRARTQAMRSRTFWGWVIVGGGVFMIIEGILSHHVLAIHHVRPGADEILWDLGWLLIGGMVVVVGWLLAASGGNRSRDDIAGTHMDRRTGRERRVTATIREPLADERRSGADRRAQVGVSR